MLQVIAQPPQARPAPRRLAVLADGDNVALEAAGPLLSSLAEYGTAIILRVYCDRKNARGWDAAMAFQKVYLDTLSGKNSADIRLVIDAMDIAQERVVDGFVILSSDRDFEPLAHRLRRFGCWVMGAGNSQTAQGFRKSCDVFFLITPLADPTVAPQAASRPRDKPLETVVYEALTKVCESGGPIRLSAFGKILKETHNLTRRDLGVAALHKYLRKHRTLFALDGSGTEMTVSLVRCKLQAPHSVP